MEVISSGGIDMCGRYYIDDEMAAEIQRIIRNIDMRLNGYREVFPTNIVPIIKAQEKMGLDNLVWGFRHWDTSKKSVMINARAETVLDKKMFKNSVVNRRCVIPAAGFYEWDKNKKKIAFSNPASKILYLAGFWKDDRFIIITTAANNSIADVHDRMPLLLEEKELENWLFDDEAYKLILQKLPGKLKREAA